MLITTSQVRPSPREWEIASFLCEDDLTAREIAMVLSISESTVNSHIQNLAHKLPPTPGRPIRRIRKWWRTLPPETLASPLNPAGSFVAP